MSNNDAVYLHHIFAAIEQIDRYTRGMSESEFLSRTMVQDAVIRQIEIIGEAANCISVEYQNGHPNLPWDHMIGICKKISPERFAVNLASVWNTIQDDLPLHKQAIKKFM
jgi:uncharacterized protein with HEPN domain